VVFVLQCLFESVNAIQLTGSCSNHGLLTFQRRCHVIHEYFLHLNPHLLILPNLVSQAADCIQQCLLDPPVHRLVRLHLGAVLIQILNYELKELGQMLWIRVRHLHRSATLFLLLVIPQASQGAEQGLNLIPWQEYHLAEIIEASDVLNWIHFKYLNVLGGHEHDWHYGFIQKRVNKGRELFHCRIQSSSKSYELYCVAEGLRFNIVFLLGKDDLQMRLKQRDRVALHLVAMLLKYLVSGFCRDTLDPPEHFFVDLKLWWT